jgi:hypothetical protein
MAGRLWIPGFLAAIGITLREVIIDKNVGLLSKRQSLINTVVAFIKTE